jgi:hypothetical protein
VAGVLVYVGILGAVEGLDGLSNGLDNTGHTGGLSVGITNGELDHIAGIGAKVLENEVTGHTINEVNFPDLGVKLSQVSVNSLTIPNATISTATGAIRPNISVCSNISMNWEYCLDLGFFGKHCDSGSAEIETDASLATNMNVTTLGGKYKMDIEKCEGIISRLKATVHGSRLSSLYNLILPLFDEPIRREIQGEICPQIDTSVKAHSDAVVNSFKRDACVDEVSCIDFSLTNSPLVDSEFVASTLKGEFFSHIKRIEHDFSPGNISLTPPVNRTHCNYYFHGTDYIINTAMDVYFKSQRMQYAFCMPQLFASLLPDCIAGFMSNFICIPSKLINIEGQVENCHEDFKVYVKASSMPTMKIMSNMLAANFSVDVDLVKGNCSLCSMRFTATSEGTVSFKATPEGHNATGHINAFKLVRS